jgi:ribosome assembly protein 3
MSEKPRSSEKKDRKRKKKERTREYKEGEEVVDGHYGADAVQDDGPKVAGKVEEGKKRRKTPKDAIPNGTGEATIEAKGIVEDAAADGADVESGAQRPQDAEPQSDFASFYLRHITQELADDLDKIRSANDFSEKSLPILIHALKQGEAIFSDEEKAMIMRGR